MAIAPGTEAQRQSPPQRSLRESARWHDAVESAIWFVSDFWVVLVVAAFAAFFSIEQRAWAVGGYQRPETLRECSSFQPRYTVPLVARSRGLARCSAPSSPSRDTRLAHTPEARRILTAPDRAHQAGAQMHVEKMPPNAVRAVGGDSNHTKGANLSRLEVDHGQVKSRHSCDWNVSTIAARRFVATARRAVFSVAAFDRPHRSSEYFFHNGPEADTSTAARAVGLVRLVERRLAFFNRVAAAFTGSNFVLPVRVTIPFPLMQHGGVIPDASSSTGMKEIASRRVTAVLASCTTSTNTFSPKGIPS